MIDMIQVSSRFHLSHQSKVKIIFIDCFLIYDVSDRVYSFDLSYCP